MIYESQRGLTVSKYWPDKTRIRKQVPNRTSAKALLTRIEASILDGTWRDLRAELSGAVQADPTIAQFSERFLADYAKPRLRASTVARYALSIKNIVRHLGNLRLGEFTRREAHEFVEHRKAELSQKHPDQQIANATVNRDLACLKKVFNYAVEVEILEGNPLSRFKLLREQQVEMHVPTTEQVVRLAESIEDPTLRSVVVLLSETGLRRAEVLRLAWPHVDLQNRMLTVTGQTKSYKVRYVPLSLRAIECLRGIVRHINNPAVFIGLRTQHEMKRIPERQWRKGRALAGLDEQTIHGLRHYRISEWVRAGIDLRTVQQLAGHADIKTTMRYAHFAASSYDRVRQLMDEAAAVSA